MIELTDSTSVTKIVIQSKEDSVVTNGTFSFKILFHKINKNRIIEKIFGL